MINPFLRSLFMMNNLSVPSVFIFSFPKFKFPRPFRRNLHLNHRKAHLIISSFILSHHPFVTGVLPGGSSWLNSFFKSSSRFCWWSSSVFFFLHLEVQLIVRIIWSGVLHFFVLLSYPVFSVCVRLSPYDLEMLPIRPQQAYSFRCWFSQQLRFNLPSKDAFNFIRGTSCHFILRSFHSTLSILSGGLVSCLHQVSFHPLKLVFYSSMFQPECCLNSSILIPFLSCSNRNGFRIHRVLWAFDSHHTRRSFFLPSALNIVLLSSPLVSPHPFSLPSRS